MLETQQINNNAASYVYQKQDDGFRSEQQRKEDLKKLVVVERPARGHSKVNNVATHGRMSASYFCMRWVNSDRILKNAAVNGEPAPVITSSGRTFTK